MMMRMARMGIGVDRDDRAPPDVAHGPLHDTQFHGFSSARNNVIRPGESRRRPSLRPLARKNPGCVLEYLQRRENAHCKYSPVMPTSAKQAVSSRTRRTARTGATNARGEASLKLIIDTTERLMLDEGYAAVSSRRVAKEAGLKPPLVHYYFPATDDLFLAVFRRAAAREAGKLDDAVQSAQSPESS